ncbi:MAG: hemerythrin domain-containing protein [Myxococcota bacterium]
MSQTAPKPSLPSLPVVPRDEWEQHPHFRTQTLLLGSHDGFREVSQHLIAAARGDTSDTLIGAIYFRWVSGMRSHEAYEEHKLYPYLAHRWGADFSAAEAGHHALHEADREVRRALLHVVEPGSPDREVLADALVAHDQALVPHLRLEEDLVIPLLLELSPREFSRLTSLPIEALIPDDASAGG